MKPKQMAKKMSEIAENYSKHIPEQLYIDIMNATKVMYDRSEENDDLENIVITPDMEPGMLKYELQGLRRQMQAAKKDMLDFKPMSRVTKQLKEKAIGSYCKHMGIRIPVHTWDCLVYYGYAQNIPVSEKELYRIYKEHYNQKVQKCADVYNIESKILDELEKNLS